LREIFAGVARKDAKRQRSKDFCFRNNEVKTAEAGLRLNFLASLCEIILAKIPACAGMTCRVGALQILNTSFRKL
jgi:hypothetical protein